MITTFSIKKMQMVMIQIM